MNAIGELKFIDSIKEDSVKKIFLEIMRSIYRGSSPSKILLFYLIGEERIYG